MIEPSVTPDNPYPDTPALTLPRIVLASGSPRRAEILAMAGVQADVRPTDAPEHRLPGDESIEAWAVRLAMDKAAAAGTNNGVITIGADTMVVVGDEVLGKPSGPAEATSTLRRLRNSSHSVITAVALDSPSGRWAGWSSTEVAMRDLSDSEIDEYVDSSLPLDKAGSYGIQDRPFNPAERIRGCYLNVVGLPLCLTGQLLELAGYDVTFECDDCDEPANTVDVTP